MALSPRMEPESGSPLLALPFSPNSIAVGTVIEARIPGGGRRWYPGKVSRDHGNGSYAVAYKYGHKEPLVHAHLMRIPPSDLSRALSEVPAFCCNDIRITDPHKLVPTGRRQGPVQWSYCVEISVQSDGGMSHNVITGTKECCCREICPGVHVSG